MRCFFCWVGIFKEAFALLKRMRLPMRIFLSGSTYPTCVSKRKSWRARKKRPPVFPKQRVLSSNNQKNGIHSLKVDVFLNVDGDIHKCEPSVPRCRLIQIEQWNSEIPGDIWMRNYPCYIKWLYHNYITTLKFQDPGTWTNQEFIWNVIKS